MLTNCRISDNASSGCARVVFYVSHGNGILGVSLRDHADRARGFKNNFMDVLQVDCASPTPRLRVKSNAYILEMEQRSWVDTYLVKKQSQKKGCQSIPFFVIATAGRPRLSVAEEQLSTDLILPHPAFQFQ